jgi:outer membrane lipoprotein carrier protein
MKISFIRPLIFNLTLLCGFILLFSIVGNSTSHAEDLDVNKLIDGLQARYGQMKGLAADFTQIYHDQAGRQLREQGMLVLKRPGKMRWEYRQPEQKLFLTDGKNVYFYVPAEREVQITPIKESDDPRAPFIFLLGRTNLRRDFTSIQISQSESATIAGNVVLEFVPKRPSNTMKRLFAEVDPIHLQLHRLALINGAGARSDFILTNMRENYQAGDEQFIFEPPPGVRVLK